MSSPPGISAFPACDSDMTFWKGRLEGAEVRSIVPRARADPVVASSMLIDYARDRVARSHSGREHD